MTRDAPIGYDRIGIVWEAMPKRTTKLSAEDAGRLADAVYETLIGQLISRAIEPEARMGVDAISRELDVSQTPVRQALDRLESEALVTRVHLAGYRAARLMTWDEFDQLFQMRLLIEPFAAGLAATHRTPEQAAAMERAEREMRALSRDGDATYSQFARADARLHEAIAVASGNPLLAQAQARLHAHIHLARLHLDTGIPADALGEHEQLLAAIVEGDEQGAARVMRRHLRASRARLFSAFAGEDAELELAGDPLRHLAG